MSDLHPSARSVGEGESPGTRPSPSHAGGGSTPLRSPPLEGSSRHTMPGARPLSAGKGWRRTTASLRSRVRYRLDAAFSRGPIMVIGWLVLLTVTIIVVAAIVISIARLRDFGDDDALGFGEAMWQAMLRLIDPGSFAGDHGWATRVVALVVTVVGIFLAGSLIGLIANAVDQRVEQLRKGRSTVLERGHTLILGWNDRVPAIIGELVIANQSRRRAAVVVLADIDKVTMEDTLHDAIEDFETTRLVCRRGSISSFADLDLVNAYHARSVIVVGDDPAVAKTLLALLGDDATRIPAKVVAEVADTETSDSLRRLFGDHVLIVSSDAVVAELTAQSCRQRGLSQVFHALLEFGGDEMYFGWFPELVGSSYAEAQMAFETSSLMGLLRASGELILNPPPDAEVLAGDRLLGIASDDSTFLVDGVSDRTLLDLHPEPVGAAQEPRRIIIVGWSSLGPRVIAELDDFLSAETTIEVVADPDVWDAEEVRSAVSARIMNLEVRMYGGRPDEVARMIADDSPSELILLGRRDGLTKEQADVRTLLILLAFEQIVGAEHLENVRVVAELLEQRHVPLAQSTGADDFVVSDELTSLMIAQLSESPELERVFRDLFESRGCVISMVPATRYGATGAACFADVVAAASGCGHSALGYHRRRDGEVRLNPAKSEPVQLAASDMIIVLRSSSEPA